jgi:hypothetical protein
MRSKGDVDVNAWPRHSAAAGTRTPRLQRTGSLSDLNRLFVGKLTDAIASAQRTSPDGARRLADPRRRSESSCPAPTLDQHRGRSPHLRQAARDHVS